jgi:hypothetical protein
MIYRPKGYRTIAEKSILVPVPYSSTSINASYSEIILNTWTVIYRPKGYRTIAEKSILVPVPYSSTSINASYSEIILNTWTVRALGTLLGLPCWAGIVI